MNKKERQLAYERERKAMNDLAMREFDRERAIEAIHKEHIETMQKQIDGFYMRYAGSEGLTRSEAMKRADQMDVTKFANKAKKAVKEKDFSPETNEWLKTYNLKMKVSRLELLKEEVNWELIQMYDKDYQLISESLREEARLELERQAGILGDSVSGARQRIDGIVNSDFYGKNFSERIWSRTGLYQNTQKEVFKSLSQIYATMDGYRNERNRLMDKMQTTEYETMRLLRTENARIGSQVQVEAYKANEFTHFIYVAEPGACDICGPLDGKIFPVSEAQIGLNLKPLHPNCRCSSHGYIAMERLVDGEWADEETGENSTDPDTIKESPVLKRARKSFERSEIKNAYGENTFNSVVENLNGIEDERVAMLFEKYVDKISFYETSVKGAAESNYSTVHMESSKFKATKFAKENEIFFHEMSHAIDNLGLRAIEGTKDYKTGKELSFKLGRKYVYKDEVITNYSGMEKFGLAKKIKTDLEDYVRGDTMTIQAFKKTLGKKPTEKEALRVWMDKVNKHEMKKYDNWNKFSEKIKKIAAEKPDVTPNISDIVEAVGGRGVAPFGHGHGGKAYWKIAGNKEAEFFAEVTSAAIRNKESFELIKEIFPNAVDTYFEIVEEMIKAGI